MLKKILLYISTKKFKPNVVYNNDNFKHYNDFTIKDNFRFYGNDIIVDGYMTNETKQEGVFTVFRKGKWAKKLNQINMNKKEKSIIKKKAKQYFEENMSGEPLCQDSIIDDMTSFTKDILKEFGIDAEKL